MKISQICTSGLALLLLTGFSQMDPELTLVPAPPEKPQVFGVSFGEGVVPALRGLADQGLRMIEQQHEGKEDALRRFRFQGVPQDIIIRSGSTEILFFQNKLIGVEFKFKPTYENYLLIKKQLSVVVGSRFVIDKKQETMDYHLRSHLAHLGTDEYSPEVENEIRQSVTKGTTFFQYVLRDKENELDVNLSFASALEGEERRPILHLRYRLIPGVKSYESFVSGGKILPILPEPH